MSNVSYLVLSSDQLKDSDALINSVTVYFSYHSLTRVDEGYILNKNASQPGLKHRLGNRDLNFAELALKVQ